MFLCLAIKISSWINIYFIINPRGHIVYTEFIILPRQSEKMRKKLPFKAKGSTFCIVQCILHHTVYYFIIKSVRLW